MRAEIPNPSWVCPIDIDGRREVSSLSLKTAVVHKSVTSLTMETNLQKGGLVHRVRELNLGRNCKNCFIVYACCFVNINTVTYFKLFLCPFKRRDMSVMPECQILFVNFALLYTVRSS